MYAMVAVLPTVAFAALLGGLRAARRLSEARTRPPAPESLDRLGARLRRLRAELEATENKAGTVAKGHHLRALRGAYADLLATLTWRRRPAVSGPGWPISTAPKRRFARAALMCGKRPCAECGTATRLPARRTWSASSPSPTCPTSCCWPT